MPGGRLLGSLGRVSSLESSFGKSSLDALRSLIGWPLRDVKGLVSLVFYVRALLTELPRGASMAVLWDMRV